MTRKPRPLIVHAPGVLAVPLTRGLFALIDEVDAGLVAAHVWQARKGRHTFYATRTAYCPKHSVQMHRTILGSVPDTHIDHIDGNGLNNRRSNLRVASVAANAVNRLGLNSNNRSGYRGVHRDRSGRWVAQAVRGGRHNYLGTHGTPEAAAEAYRRFAHGMLTL